MWSQAPTHLQFCVTARSSLDAMIRSTLLSLYKFVTNGLKNVILNVKL